MVIDHGAYCFSLILSLVSIIGHRMVIPLVLIMTLWVYFRRASRLCLGLWFAKNRILNISPELLAVPGNILMSFAQYQLLHSWYTWSVRYLKVPAPIDYDILANDLLLGIPHYLILIKINQAKNQTRVIIILD